jgi:hypothetical protein
MQEEKLKYFKPGLEVLYQPILNKTSNMPAYRTKLNSEPWQLGHGDWVVKIEGYTGGISIDHLSCAHSVGSVENNIAKCSDCGLEARIV